MAKSKKPEVTDANLSIPQIKAAIPALKRRLEELKQVDVNSLDIDDPAITGLETRLDSFLSSTFGTGSADYNRYRSIRNLYEGSFYTNRSLTLHEYQEGILEGIKKAISKLEGLLADFEEKVEDAGVGNVSKAIRAYEGLELHPQIERVAGQLFRDGHYANAVEDAVKELNLMVKNKSGRSEDGVSLMQTVFSVNKPILKFNELKDDSDKNVQMGYMNLFAGAVMGLRNPRAHKNIKDEPERALEFIAFISLLAKLVDESR